MSIFEYLSVSLKHVFASLKRFKLLEWQKQVFAGKNPTLLQFKLLLLLLFFFPAPISCC